MKTCKRPIAERQPLARIVLQHKPVGKRRWQA
jgi:hypothetical protein